MGSPGTSKTVSTPIARRESATSAAPVVVGSLVMAGLPSIASDAGVQDRAVGGSGREAAPAESRSRVQHPHGAVLEKRKDVLDRLAEED